LTTSKDGCHYQKRFIRYEEGKKPERGKVYLKLEASPKKCKEAMMILRFLGWVGVIMVMSSAN
jgi:hypothetical protein